MKKNTYLLALITSALPMQAFSYGCIVDHKGPYGHTNTCYENVSIPKEQFRDLCMSSTFYTSEGEEDVITNTLTAECIAPFLGGCENTTYPFSNGKKVPYNMYYRINSAMDITEKSCRDNGGTWIDKR